MTRGFGTVVSFAAGLALLGCHSEAIGRLSEHMAGLRSNPELEIDLVPSELDTFTRRIFKETRRISYGKTWTYKRLAEACGRPDGYRVVQAALSQNPIPI